MREALVRLDESEFAALGIDELVSLCRAAGTREFEELACHGDSAVVQVAVERRLDEERLADLAYVERWERVSDSADTHLYVVAFSAPELSERLADRADDLVGTGDPEVDDRGATMSLVGPQQAIADTISEYENDGVTPALERLGEYGGPERPLDELTDRQREVLQTAFEMGYYKVPRDVSTGDVAAELALDPSTVAEHLQRAERNLLRYHLAPE